MLRFQCRSLKFLICALFLGLFGTVQGRIIETRYIQDVNPLIDEETWLLVDLDNCMFEGAEALGHANWFYDEMQKRIEKGMTRDEAIAHAYPLWVKVQKVSSVKPLEAHFVPTLLALQNRGICIMGLTHRQPSVADSTANHVSSLGFNFLSTAPSKECFSIPAKTPTLFYQGILFVGDYNKKIDVFDPFLKKINQKPKKIVFVDDKRKNVEELEALAEQGIEYIGIHYTAIQYAKPVYDREIAEYQAKFLDKVMSNEAALLLMENGVE